MDKFEIKRSTDRQYYFNYVASNGRVIATSERYESKQGAQKGAQVIKDGARTAPIVEENH